MNDVKIEEGGPGTLYAVLKSGARGMGNGISELNLTLGDERTNLE